VRRYQQAGTRADRAVDGLKSTLSQTDDDPVGEAVSRAEERASVKAAVEALDDELKEVVYLRYYNGLPYDRIASLLEVPMTTIDGRLRRAKAQLMKELKGKVEL